MSLILGLEAQGLTVVGPEKNQPVPCSDATSEEAIRGSLGTAGLTSTDRVEGLPLLAAFGVLYPQFHWDLPRCPYSNYQDPTPLQSMLSL